MVCGKFGSHCFHSSCSTSWAKNDIHIRRNSLSTFSVCHLIYSWSWEKGRCICPMIIFILNITILSYFIFMIWNMNTYFFYSLMNKIHYFKEEKAKHKTVCHTRIQPQKNQFLRYVKRIYVLSLFLVCKAFFYFMSTSTSISQSFLKEQNWYRF